MDSKKLAKLALAGVVSAGLAAAATQAVAAEGDMEKCYGIVKKTMNDCGTPLHACAGQATKDSDPTEWLLLPKGSCEKIVGGKLARDKDAKEKAS